MAKTPIVDDPARQCHGKRSYKRKRDARLAIRRMRSSGGPRKLAAYKCPHCGRHHIGGESR